MSVLSNVSASVVFRVLVWLNGMESSCKSPIKLSIWVTTRRLNVDSPVIQAQAETHQRQTPHQIIEQNRQYIPRNA